MDCPSDRLSARKSVTQGRSPVGIFVYGGPKRVPHNESARNHSNRERGDPNSELCRRICTNLIRNSSWSVVVAGSFTSIRLLVSDWTVFIPVRQGAPVYVIGTPSMVELTCKCNFKKSRYS